MGNGNKMNFPTKFEWKHNAIITAAPAAAASGR